MIEYGFAVCGRIIVENERLLFKFTIKAGPEFPGFQNGKIKALTIIGAKQVSIPFFINRIRAVVPTASSQPGDLGFAFRFHFSLLSASAVKAFELPFSKCLVQSNLNAVLDLVPAMGYRFTYK